LHRTVSEEQEEERANKFAHHGDDVPSSTCREMVKDHDPERVCARLVGVADTAFAIHPRQDERDLFDGFADGIHDCVGEGS
jgi:hypothetical protein